MALAGCLLYRKSMDFGRLVRENGKGSTDFPWKGTEL